MANRFLVRDSVKSIRFDGTDDVITTSIIPSTTAFSFMMWVKMPTVASSDRILDYGAAGPSGGFNFTLNNTAGRSTGVFTIYNVGSTVVGHTANIRHGRWMHIAGTYAVNSAYLYVDGVASDPDTTCTMTAAAAQTLTIGRRSTGATNFFEGLMSELVFVNGRALTAAEVTEHFRRGKVPSDATLHYVFHDNAIDQTGNGNDGTVAGTPAYVTDRPFALRT